MIEKNKKNKRYKNEKIKWYEDEKINWSKDKKKKWCKDSSARLSLVENTIPKEIEKQMRMLT